MNTVSSVKINLERTELQRQPGTMPQKTTDLKTLRHKPHLHFSYVKQEKFKMNNNLLHFPAQTDQFSNSLSPTPTLQFFPAPPQAYSFNLAFRGTEVQSHT